MFYAQIDETGVCTGTLNTFGTVDHPNMIVIEADFFALSPIGWIYVDGEWTAPTPADPATMIDPITLIGQSLAEMELAQAEQAADVKLLGQMVADIMIGGA